LASHQVPEMLRIPLEQLVLQVQALAQDEASNPFDFLDQAIDPPPRDSIAAAVDTLQKLGALKHDYALTPLGRHMAAIPADVHTSRMLLFGAILGAATATATICALMANKSPFSAPVDKRGEADACRDALAIHKSDQITLLRVYEEWALASRAGRHEAQQYCRAHFVSDKVMREVREQRKDFLNALHDLGYGLGNDADDYNRKPRILQAVLCAGLYPNVAQVKAPKQQYQETAGGALAVAPKDSRELRFFAQSGEGSERVFVHPSSVNFKTREYETSWIVFQEKVATSKTFLRAVTMVPPYALLLFGGAVSTQEAQGTVSVDGWIKFRASPDIAVLVSELRKELDKLLLCKFEDPSLDLSSSDVVTEMLSLIQSGGLQ